MKISGRTQHISSEILSSEHFTLLVIIEPRVICSNFNHIHKWMFTFSLWAVFHH